MFNRLIGLFGNPKRKHVYHDSIECLVAALEARDMYTSGHSNRVADMAYDLAKSLNIKGSHLEDIHIAAHLHDIGKLGIPDNILNKKGKLLPHEWEEIKRHPEIGCHILQKSKALQQVAEIVLHHHERWDGKGYPAGLKGHSIPLGARIIAVADSIDAMVSERPYRSTMTWEVCMEEITLNKGIQFDPAVVEAAQKLWSKWAVAAQNKKEAM
jgi:putative nucleotidyltransferase with HDIG domain